MKVKYFKCKTGFTPDIVESINEFGINNNIKTFSGTVRVLVDYGLKYEKISKILNDIDTIVNRINHKLNYHSKLIKQLYSDLELEYHTNIKYNKEIKKIDSNIFNNNFDK